MIASSHPLPSGAPQTVNGTTATFFSGADVEIEAETRPGHVPDSVQDTSRSVPSGLSWRCDASDAR